MKICLISPQRLLELNTPTLKSTPPLGLAYIAGSLKHAGHQLTVIDAIAENPQNIFSFDDAISVNGISYETLAQLIPADTEIIGFTFMFSNNWLLYRKLIEVIGDKFPQAIIIAGGEHISALPEFCLRQAKNLTACVIGEGEDTVVELVRALQKGEELSKVEGIVFKDKSGQIHVNQRRSRVREISQLPMPAWELFPLENYEKFKLAWGVDRGKSLPIMATRGCPYSCTFCSSPLMWTTRYYMREPKEVLDEISFLYHNYEIRNFDFYDLTAVIKKAWIIDFCRVLDKSGLKITWQIPAGTRSEAIDFEVAQWLYKAGCRNITYAPESGSPEILKAIKKKVSLANILQSMKASNKAGLNIKLNMIIGFPEEHHRHIWQTLWFLIETSFYGAHDAIPAIFSPYPGSELFARLIKEGELNPDDDNYFRNLVFYDSLTTNKIYNHHIHPYWVRFYQIFLTLVFYFFNYLFRPQRFFVTVKNIITKKAESRAEDTFLDFVRGLARNRNAKSALTPNPISSPVGQA